MTDEQAFTDLDRGFARFLAERSRLSGASKNRFETLLLQLSAQQSAGHSCIAIGAEDREIVLASGLASADRATPLIAEAERLYLQRYWHYEERLARQLGALARQQFNAGHLEACLERYFPSQGDEIDWQKTAAQAAVGQALSIITGGPGTGKTTTVLKILALLLETSRQSLHVALAAPTGKAAMRLQESIVANKPGLDCAAEVKDRIPEQANTLHRLLGAKPPTPYFRHDAGNPLPYDVVVVDETSMVDLALMSKLVDALKPGSRLILLGDKDQLASVESGSVLADLSAGLAENTVELQKSHRFQGQIKQLAVAVNRQDVELAWQQLQQPNSAVRRLSGDPIDWIIENYAEYLQAIADGADPVRIFAAFNRFRVLCSNQRGHNSVGEINRRVEQELASRGKIRSGSIWYAGKPVMITANHAGMQLYNGDIGLCLNDAEHGGQLRVFFPRGEQFRKLLPARLPPWETVFAMTIHKSQGSEFENIVIALPDAVNPVLSKELLYTAITRAKKSVAVSTEQAIFDACVGHRVARYSGLAAKLQTYASGPSR
ncbi:exodeoxyribonuclease V subunit alpha [Methylomonas koyamae]|uniref:RecBCD enzyme subunit RecD n=1 Tax=Methylomonas koyamae TaxID=702114 RepID=A0A177NBW5_9GAMM|nr:exodeoxyribonuclease V subunit alpha [Methylomonas koyamae]OAI15556.1 exodeoxyribonuclease V subunit alpha [Methylomonas koyamae]